MLCIGFIAGVTSSALPATTVAFIALGINDDRNAQKASIASGKVFGCGESFTILETINHYVDYINLDKRRFNEPAITTLTKMLSVIYKCD